MLKEYILERVIALCELGDTPEGKKRLLSHYTNLVVAKSLGADHHESDKKRAVVGAKRDKDGKIIPVYSHHRDPDKTISRLTTRLIK
jgi:hypothetical protein